MGGFYITATPRPTSRTDVVEAAVYDELARLQKEPIADWELQKAKSGARRNYINGLQSSLGRATTIGQYAVYYNDPNLINTRIDKVNAVTKEDVQRVAQKYIDINHMQIVAVGDASKTREVLAKFGTVQEYDSDGKPARTAAKTEQ